MVSVVGRAAPHCNLAERRAIFFEDGFAIKKSRIRAMEKTSFAKMLEVCYE